MPVKFLVWNNNSCICRRNCSFCLLFVICEATKFKIYRELKCCCLSSEQVSSCFLNFSYAWRKRVKKYSFLVEKEIFQPLVNKLWLKCGICSGETTKTRLEIVYRVAYSYHYPYTYPLCALSLTQCCTLNETLSFASQRSCQTSLLISFRSSWCKMNRYNHLLSYHALRCQYSNRKAKSEHTVSKKRGRRV